MNYPLVSVICLCYNQAKYIVESLESVKNQTYQNLEIIIWDDASKTCHFKMLKGDYDKLEGVWSFQEEGSDTIFKSVVDYEYKVPGIGALVYKVIHSLVVKNLDDTLNAIKIRAEQQAKK